MRHAMKTIIVTGALLFAAVAAAAPAPPLEVVPQLDLKRYAGRWYEIASFPQRFQKGCVDSRADYRLRDDGNIDVVNSCLKEGTLDIARGKAWVADRTSNAKLKVSFFWPFRGDYWVIELGKEYDYAVVSAPSRKYLWILAREPKMDAELYAAIVGRLKDRGFDVSRLQSTYQGVRTDH
jgi:apolipoprotein D and lipocalin family protein